MILRGCEAWYFKLPDRRLYDLLDSTSVYELLMKSIHTGELELYVMPFVAPGSVQSFNDWNQFCLMKQWRYSSN